MAVGFLHGLAPVGLLSNDWTSTVPWPSNSQYLADKYNTINSIIVLMTFPSDLGRTDMNRRRILLQARPEGVPGPEHFRLVEEVVPDLSEGEVLVAHDWIGLQPAARIRMSANDSYAAPTPLGDAPYCQTVGRIVASRNPTFSEGELVSHDGGWQSHSISDGSTLLRLDERIQPESLWLGALGLSGMTAFVGLHDVAKVQRGETVVVSAATGAVGAIAGQIARDMGARVIGIAGGPAKCKFAVGDLGYHACIDHQAPDFAEKLAAATPDGIDVDFENVGGAVRDAVVHRMNNFGRIALCGLVSEYNASSPVAGPAWHLILVRRLTVQGFLLRDRIERRPAFLEYAVDRIRSGQLKFREDVTEGLENTPQAFARMLTGKAFGKALVKL